MESSLRATKSFKKISSLKKRIKVIQGSQGAGKTFSILIRWVLLAVNSDQKQRCSIVSSTFPELSDGAAKDFEDICEMLGVNYRKIVTPRTYTINKWVFKFHSVDSEKKARGGRRDRLFINEANRLSWAIAKQLISRTHKEVILDFNPSAKFWAHDKYVDTGIGEFLKLTYKDNDQLPQSEIDEIEMHAPWGAVPDENYWRVFGLGEIGFVEGVIFKNYELFKELPEGDIIESVGVDFGDKDPMTATHVVLDRKNRSLYWNTFFYKSESNIKELCDSIKANIPHHKNLHVYCDHNGTLIREMWREGIRTAKNAYKGKTIPDRIKSLKQYKIMVHEESIPLKKEMDEYKYKKQGDFFIDYPDQSCDEHAIDGAGYGSMALIN